MAKETNQDLYGQKKTENGIGKSLNLNPKRKKMTTNERMIEFYANMLQEIKKVGVGNRTRHNTVVTDLMIDNVKKRLEHYDTRNTRSTKSVKTA